MQIFVIWMRRRSTSGIRPSAPGCRRIARWSYRLISKNYTISRCTEPSVKHWKDRRLWWLSRPINTHSRYSCASCKNPSSIHTKNTSRGWCWTTTLPIIPVLRREPWKINSIRFTSLHTVQHLIAKKRCGQSSSVSISPGCTVVMSIWILS